MWILKNTLIKAAEIVNSLLVNVVSSVHKPKCSFTVQKSITNRIGGENYCHLAVALLRSKKKKKKGSLCSSSVYNELHSETDLFDMQPCMC
jgi:hypothetical protein